ncbi:MAG: lipoprotein [Proteobacteria bacterium]|nr:lipoprotein [Pseudomonadota bacterium]
MKHTIPIFSIFCLLAALTLAACGVKTDPERPNGKDFPRNYPTY